MIYLVEHDVLVPDRIYRKSEFNVRMYLHVFILYMQERKELRKEKHLKTFMESVSSISMLA